MHEWFNGEHEIIQELLEVNQKVCKQNLPFLNFIGDMPINSAIDFKGEAFNSF
jgi:hypothetical protein